LVVDAKDESAAAFYQHHGLTALPSQPMTLFLPLATASGARIEGPMHDTMIATQGVL
jgi:hypothetical protein